MSKSSTSSKQQQKTEAVTKTSKQIEAEVAEAPKRNLEGSLEQTKEELSNAYMNFSELANRCILEISTINKTDKPVYYFKPDTFLLDDPDRQRYFRESLLKKISATPKPEPITYLGDEMHRIFLSTVADQSRATICKKNLAMYFKRRQYALQHLKYKVLCRWAHHAMTSQVMETGKDAVFLFGKIEYSIEQAMNRKERLEQEDFYDVAIPANRPNTKAELGEGSLYVENVDLQPQSLLRDDDVEIFMRSTSYRNKVSKVINKFMSRLKWMPMLERYEIYAAAITASQNQKKANIQKQLDFIDKIDERAKSMHIMNSEVEAELNSILNMHHVRTHALMYTTQAEQIANSWRNDHDSVPNLINNQHELKLRIMSAAEQYGIKGDIELDHGYSFSYRVTVKFPQYFQRQMIKSQFSLYDVFAKDEDKNKVQKHTLTNMTRVDTNIFRDMSTTPNMVPDDESLAYELRNDHDIKVIRLKSSAYWIDYVCMLPTEQDWHRKQQALLNNNNPIDTLTRSSINFLDVNDLASVNRINEDNALLHQQATRKLLAFNPHDMVIHRTQNSANDGERKYAINLQDNINSTNEAAQMDKHLMGAIQGTGIAQDMGKGRADMNVQDKTAVLSRSGLRSTPQHLLVSFFTLRYMKSRDNKTKILYALNFCRAVQKRLSLDLREFGTRERIDSHMNQPYVHSTDADKRVVNNVNLSKSPYEGVSDDKGGRRKTTAEQEREDSKYEKMAVFDADAIANMKVMPSVRMYKANGSFNNKVFSTCPSVPKFHCTFGEPTMRQTEDMEMDSKASQGGISKSSLKLMGRVDHIELNEKLEEVYVKDDFGVYIMYDAVLQDMQGMEEELVKICSFYINKMEVLQDVHTEKPQPSRDRLETLSDLLELEATFQFKKVKLCMAYLECYEHIVDPLEQQRLMQVITDVMSRRPRLNMQANYFRDSYTAEFDCLDNQLELLKMLIQTQVKLERTQNKMLQDSLSLSYTLCNQYEQNRFKYQDAEELLSAVMNQERANKAAKKYADVMQSHDKRKKAKKGQGFDIGEIDQVHEADDNEEVSGGESASGNKKQGSSGNGSNADGKTKGDEASDHDLDGVESINSGLSAMDIIKDQDNVFQNLLGLPEISIETLYMAAKEKDKTILNLMNQHTNFIQIHEGFPEFLNFQQGGTNGEAMKNFKATPWSDPIAHMDFYDSLGFVNAFASISQQVQQELYDALKPYDPSMMTHIDSQVAQFALKEFRKVLQIQEGGQTEYEGRQYVEDESVMGNADKMTFYAKEMISNLTLAPKVVLDPFLIAKMNVNTITNFDFPKMPKNMNKYTMQFQDGVKPADWVIKMHKQALVDSAKRKSTEKAINIEHVIATSQIQINNNRNIDVPTQLQTYCNIVELMRLRHEIILAASECSMLEQIYLKQAEACKMKSMSVFMPDAISFDPVDIHDDEGPLINYFDDGTSHSVKIGLAAREYDPALLSNFNFRNPDTFKFNITDAGLEEVRAVLTYQLLQKHLLVVATRLNQLMIDNSLKAITELDILKEHNVSVPNSTSNLSSVISKNSDSVSSSMFKEERLKFSQNMSNNVANVFYSIIAKKRQMRTDIAKEYSNYMSKVSRVHTVKNQSVQRVMRSFKVKQLVRYCEQIVMEAHLDAQKVQAVQVCQRLRTFSQYFTFDPQHLDMTVIQKGKPGEPRKEDYQIFQYETNNMIENFTYPYTPKVEENDALDVDSQQTKEIRGLNPHTMTILDTSVIPSTANLVNCESSSIEELRTFRAKLHKIHKGYNKNYQEELKNLDVTINEPERQTKEMLPAFTQKDNDPSQGKGKPEDSDIDKQGYPLLDYEEALNFASSKYAQMIRFYQYMERIIGLEWFICKLQFRQDTLVHMDNAINYGLPFWMETDQEKRMKKEINNRPLKQGVNPIAQDFVHSNIVSRQSKKYIAEEISNVSLTIQNLLREYAKTNDTLKYEYINSYTEFRYMQILGSFHKIIQQFYIQGRGGNGIRSLREAISQLTKTDHVHTSYSKGNSYHVNTSLVHPHMQLLEPTNLIYGAHSEDEFQNFNRCVRPVINEKALEPPQLTLFQSLYQTDSFRKRLPTQFAGQMVSSHNAFSFKSLDTALLDMTYEDRTYAQSFIMQSKDQANDYMEIVLSDPSLSAMKQDEVYSLFQLPEAKKYLTETTQALLLKNAIICWNENQVLPDSASVYKKFEENFRNLFFWKIIEHKENMVQNIAARGHDAIPTKQVLAKLQEKIDNLQANYSMSTTTEEEHRKQMIEHLKEEFSAQKKKVILDTVYSTKAEIMVLSNEIEKHITRASVQALDAEHAALSRCFNLSQPKIQYRIHPFQQFAATLYDKVDVQQHLDMANKLPFVQEFLTKLRNRGTEVETLTSGPGVVFTVKDFNDAIQNFSRKIITYGEKELNSRSDMFAKKEEHYMQLLYVKDQQVTDLESRAKNTAKNIEDIISAKLFEKGNQLIYQLDSTSRLLILFKQTMFGLENEVRGKILGEQSQRFKLQKDALDTQIEKLGDYKKHVAQIVGEKFSQDYDDVMTTLRKHVEKVYDIDPASTNYCPPNLYPATGNNNYRNPVQQIIIKTEGSSGNGTGGGGGGYCGERVIQGKDLPIEVVGTLPGSVIPQGFQHYSHCSCFQPSKKYPNYTMELAELEMYSEQEARFELARACEFMRKQRLFWRTKEMLTKQKFQNQINLMKKQLSNNAYLWDQMAECEKRETILKQELLFTQQSLSAAEKVIEKLQDEMKKVEADRQRLYKYKHSKAERLKELEDKIKKFEVYENIDTDKLINVLGKKDEECKQLQGIADNYTNQISMTEHRKEKEVGHYKGRLIQEQVKTQQIVEKMEQMKLELKMLESNDTSVAAIWKKKCLDLFEVCQTLKTENEELRDRCKELIMQGIQLADAVNQENDQQSLMLAQPTQQSYVSPQYQAYNENVQLPRLQSNTSVQRMNNQAFNKPVPATAGMTSGRMGSSTANTYDGASNNGGYAIDSRLQNGIQSAQGNPRDSHLISANGSMMGGNQLLSNYQTTHGGGDPTKLGNSFDKHFAATMGAHGKTGQFGAGGKAASMNRSPQLQPMLFQGQKAQPGRMNMNQRKVMPQTQHQQQRGKTQGPSGPTYYMPGSSDVPAVIRPGQYTRQKGRQQPRSILGSGGGPGHEPLAESSFNASFHASTDKFGSTVRSQIASQQQNNRMAYLQKTPQAQVTQFEGRGQGRPQQRDISGLNNYLGVEKHQDSLFESSKASTNLHQTSNMRRQFGAKPVGQTLTQAQQNKNQMLGAAIFGSKMGQKQPGSKGTQPSAMKGASTKPSSMVTEITSNVKQITSEHQPPKPTDDSFMNEASFAAAPDMGQHEGGMGGQEETTGTKARVNAEVKLTRNVTGEVTRTQEDQESNMGTPTQ